MVLDFNYERVIMRKEGISMKYKFSTEVRKNEVLRESFNQLTQQVFCFDFADWYEAGHWGDDYLPHVLLDGERVVSNVSVNLMKFDVDGVQKKYIQLGTVMTDSNYRKQGLNREIMQHVIKEYLSKVDGIYLFANDSVVDYYPKFGFQPTKEYEYYLRCEDMLKIEAYQIEKVDIKSEQCKQLDDKIKEDAIDNNRNQNDGMYMSENLGLYQFWLANGYSDQVYSLPEIGCYVIADCKEDILELHQILGKQPVDMLRLAKAFGESVKEVVLGYTPVKKELFLVREYKEEDCTLFILGEDLQRIERDQMRFPVLSHA